MIVSVCTTCKTADGGTVVGPDMFAAVRAALGKDDPNVVVRPVQCLSVCKRPATVAVDQPGRLHVFVRRSASRQRHPALASFVKSYRNSGYGLVPWRERAEVLRKGMLARVPPMRVVAARRARAEMRVWRPRWCWAGRAPANRLLPSGWSPTAAWRGFIWRLQRPDDEEMEARIAHHRAQRGQGGQGWTTIEEPLALVDALTREATHRPGSLGGLPDACGSPT